MASITNRGGLRVLQFTEAGKRRTVTLGRVTKRIAELIRRHVEEIVSARRAGTSPGPETFAWLATIGKDLHAKLAAVGLVAPREQPKALQLAGFVERYISHRRDVGKGTSEGYRGAGNRLIAYFTSEKSIASITEGDADRWAIWMKAEKHYSGATVSKSIKVARQLWEQARRDGLVSANPFKHLRCPSEVNTARAYFVDRQTFGLVLDACPDDEWRLLLALARYGGLRTPSETLSLTWRDVNWERGRFRIVSPKTKHHDGGERWVPLFPELLPLLRHAFEQAKAGTVHVIQKWRHANINLRQRMYTQILPAAGVKAWPRLFQNLRASRETELAEAFPIHVVAEWLGNSPKTALAHYTQTTEEHYRRAAGEATEQSKQGVKIGLPNP